MADISVVTRQNLGRPLTWEEMDANWTGLANKANTSISREGTDTNETVTGDIRFDNNVAITSITGKPLSFISLGTNPDLDSLQDGAYIYDTIGAGVVRTNLTLFQTSTQDNTSTIIKTQYRFNPDGSKIETRLYSANNDSWSNWVIYNGKVVEHVISNIIESDIINNYNKNNFNVSDATFNQTSTTGLVLNSFYPVIFDTDRLECVTTNKRALWLVIGYNDANNLSLVGLNEYSFNQVINVDLSSQTFSIVKAGAIGNYLGKITVTIEGDNINSYLREETTPNKTLSISELKSLGANLNTLTLGLCAYQVGSLSTGVYASDIKISKEVILELTDLAGQNSNLAMSQKGATDLVKPLQGKKISILGDSISTFAGYIPSGNATYFPNANITSVEQTWWKKLINYSGLELEVNNSWSGSRITNGRGADSMFCAEARYSSLGNPDIMIVFGGTNDFGQGTPNTLLGEYNLITNGTRDLSQFRQACQFLAEKLQTLYNSSQIYFCIPTQRNFGIFDENAENWTQQDLWDTIREICNMYGIRIIDLSKCGINTYNYERYLSDGLHPLESGMQLIADYVYSELLKGQYGKFEIT